MADNALLSLITSAASLDDVKKALEGHPELNPERVWEEAQKHRSGKAEKLDLSELESVSGGKDRDWINDGCAATCEEDSWCWSNDRCDIWDVTYDRFWECCPDGHPHNYVDNVCTRCGHHEPNKGYDTILPG